jgi:hypothetical protein
MPVRNTEDHLVHLSYHLDRGEEDLQEVKEGRIPLDEWAMENAQVHKHIMETVQVATVPQELEAELNSMVQRAQQFGAIVVNGIRMANKKAQDAQAAAEEQQQAQDAEGLPQEEKDRIAFENSERRKQMDHQAKLQRDAEMHQLKLQQSKQLGDQKIVLEIQKAMAKIAEHDPELQKQLGEVGMR